MAQFLAATAAGQALLLVTAVGCAALAVFAHRKTKTSRHPVHKIDEVGRYELARFLLIMGSGGALVRLLAGD